MKISDSIKTSECLGYTIFTDNLNNIPSQPRQLINTINQYSYCIAEEDDEFKNVLLNSDILLPDGVGILLASRILNGFRIKKIAGADLHEFQLKKLNNQNGSCFYLGASKSTLEKIERRIRLQYSNISIGCYSPPFKDSFSNIDNVKMLDAVNAFKPDVLFIGMTAPKQEKWAYSNKHALNAKLICSIGAVFDFYAGTIERPSQIWQQLGLEWLGRLIKEPRRMWKRYIYYGIIFAKHLMVKKLEDKR